MTTPIEATSRLAKEHGVDDQYDGKKVSQTTQIVDMVKGSVSLWHSDENEPFATIENNGHRENWPLKSRAFRDYIDSNFYTTHGKAPNSQVLQAAIGTLRGIALFDSPEHKVWTRVATCERSIILDLGDANWNAVTIGPNGWTVTNQPPVKFRRPKSMQALPAPKHGGDLDLLRGFLNLASDDDWVLARAWLIQSIFEKGPYPVLTLHGEAGSAKSTVARVLKSCADPTIAPLRSQPRNEHDLLIAAKNSWVIALDNLSSLSGWISDALCRLATGGGLATRELYSDDDESLFDVQRPIILNGITTLANRGDLLDRCILLTLPVIAENERRTEEDFWNDFSQAHPTILGGLLDAVAGALRKLPAVKLDRMPRMADFARRAVAAEVGQGWKRGAFMTAYAQNRAGANDTAVEASMVATAVIDLMASRDEWTGAMTKLLTELNNLVDDAIIRRKGWPADGARLGRELRRTAPNLRASGIDIKFDTPSRRSMTVRKVLHSTDITDMPSQTASNTTTEGVDAHDSNLDGNVGSYSATPITVTASGRGRPGTKQL